MRDLVQELRELAKETDMESFSFPACKLWEALAGKDVIDCFDGRRCFECRALALNALADRIEREYDPKPEPDTLEKVALDMLDTFVKSAEACEEENVSIFIDHECPDRYRKRLKALGVKIDDQ